MVANGQQIDPSKAALIGGGPKYLVRDIPHPNAHPCFASLPMPGGVQSFLIGGLSKLEHASIEIAARNPQLSADEAVERAADVLNQCLRYEQSPGEAPAEEPAEPGQGEPSPIVLPE